MKQWMRFIKDYISLKRIDSIVGPIPLFEQEEFVNDIRDKSGIYFFVSKSHRYIYPSGESPIIYIGTSNNLKRRLKEHLKSFHTAQQHLYKKDIWIYSRYNYIIHHGADVYYLPTIGKEDAKNLESKVLENFFDKYASLPVGNGAFSYRK